MNITIAVPSYRGMKCKPFIDSLEWLCNRLVAKGHKPAVLNRVGSPYIQQVRNELTRKFYNRGDDVLLFLDDDISFDVQKVIELIEDEYDVSCCVYREKSEDIVYPVKLCSNESTKVVKNSNGYLLADLVPAGCLKIKRVVVDLMYKSCQIEKYNIIPPCDNHQSECYNIFPQGIHRGVFVGEDYAFCLLWQRFGGKIWVKPDVDITHYFNETEYYGNYSNYLAGN